MFKTPPKLKNTMKIADFKRVLSIFKAHLASSNLHQLYRRPRDALVSVGGRQELVLEVHQLNRQPSELIFKFPSSSPHR